MTLACSSWIYRPRSSAGAQKTLVEIRSWLNQVTVSLVSALIWYKALDSLALFANFSRRLDPANESVRSERTERRPLLKLCVHNATTLTPPAAGGPAAVFGEAQRCLGGYTGQIGKIVHVFRTASLALVEFILFISNITTYNSATYIIPDTHVLLIPSNPTEYRF